MSSDIESVPDPKNTSQGPIYIYPTLSMA